MGRFYQIGHERHTVPVPPVEADTVYIEAGPLVIGVEYRVVTDAVLDDHYAKDEAARRAHWEVRAELGVAAGEVDDHGPSVHVFDAESKAEYLRFDIFEGDPHYHYITPGEKHVAVAFDDIANVPYGEWVLIALARKMPEMLRKAEADALADRVDPVALEAALPKVAQALARVETLRRPKPVQSATAP
jgi:hypothetical protein